jgi:hypothetical protein
MDATPQLGDHLTSPRPGFMHHGIYVGRGIVLHYGGNSVPGVRAKVEEVTLARFASDGGFSVVAYKNRRFSRAESVRRAYTRLGEDHYCVVSNNCQHFVEWCIVGVHKSGQVANRAGVAAGAVVATGTGIVSGLAAIGGGVAMAGAAPALAVAGLLNRTIYRRNPGQQRSERVARRIGATTTAAVSVFGAVSAFGAASGTAAGGAAVAAASPAIAAAAIGYGAYRVSRKLLRRIDKPPLDALPNLAIL